MTGIKDIFHQSYGIVWYVSKGVKANPTCGVFFQDLNNGDRGFLPILRLTGVDK
jgi:hypothetical protein